MAVGVIGLGYVGLPLAVEFAEAGQPVIAVDIDDAKVAAIRAGQSYVEDIPSERLRAVLDQSTPTPTSHRWLAPTRCSSACRRR